MESKKEIYDLIPPEYYPKTILVLPNENLEAILQRINSENIQFPLIAKPDIGLRGTAVKKIHTTEELENYLKKAKFDILIQDLIPYENEIGLFYVKLPNQPGKITGLRPHLLRPPQPPRLLQRPPLCPLHLRQQPQAPWKCACPTSATSRTWP